MLLKLEEKTTQDKFKKDLIESLITKNQESTGKAAVDCLACYADFDN